MYSFLSIFLFIEALTYMFKDHKIFAILLLGSIGYSFISSINNIVYVIQNLNIIKKDKIDGSTEYKICKRDYNNEK